MIFGLLHGGEHGELNGVGFVEMCKILAMKHYFSLKQHHLRAYRRRISNGMEECVVRESMG